MTEGRRSQVVLLDERRLEILIQPKLYAGELLDLVASHFNLKEKEYFGLSFMDDIGHFTWLQLDRRVLEHDIPKKSNQQPLVLYFLVKFYIESISQLRDSATVELFYLQAKSLVFKGQIEVDSDTSFELAAHVLQATHGDYIDDYITKSNLKKLPVLPTSVLKEHPSLSYCEEKVIAHYKKLCGQSRGYSIVNYMTIVESVPTYGVHYFEVKDKGGIPWWLGLSFKGIALFDYADKKTPRKVFPWKQLENLYFRDRKFSIEVHDPKRVSVSRRTFGPGNVTVHAWFCVSQQLTRCIWSMAISQHQFYLDRKQTKLNLARRLSEIAADLSQSCHSLSGDSIQNSVTESCGSNITNSTLPDSEETESEVSRAARMEMIAALKARKEALEAKLQEKTNELKILCIKEAELTGELPPEIPLVPGEPLPPFRKRVGTAFSLPENLINRIKSKEEEALAKLELEYEIQCRITSAALKLANDISAKKSVRKQRKITYQQSHAKLKDIEQRLINAKKAVAQKKHMRNQVKKKQPRPSSDGEDHNDDSQSLSTEENDLVFHEGFTMPKYQTSTCFEETNNQLNKAQQMDVLNVERTRSTPSPCNSSSSSSIPGHSVPSPSTPTSPIKHPSSSSSRTSSPSSSRYPVGGYIPSSVYQTKSAYRTQQYPTFSTRSHSTSSYTNHPEYDNVHFSSGTLNPAYRNKYDASVSVENRGLYSVPRQRTSQAFPSQEDLDNLLNLPFHHHHHPHPHHSHHHRHSRHTGYNQNRYGSLDRTLHNSNACNSPQPKLESRSLDNLEYSAQQESGSCMTLPVSRDTIDTALSQDYLDCPVSPHYDNVIMYPYDNLVEEHIHRQYHALPDPHKQGNKISRPTYLNYANPEHVHKSGRSGRSSASPQFPHLYPETPPPIYTPMEELVAPKYTTDDISPKVKPKEWYETSLDSPAPSRKQNILNGKPPKIPSQSIASGDSIQGRSGDPDSVSSFIQVPFETPQNQVLVTMGHFQPYREVTKPYELSDYYKYSTKVRKASQSSAKSESDTSPSSASNSIVTSSGVSRSSSGILPSTVDMSISQSSNSRPNSPFLSPVSPTVPCSPFTKMRHESGNSPHRSQVSLRSPSPLTGQASPVQMQAGVMFKSPQQSHYQPLKPMTCEPLRDVPPMSAPTSPKSSSQTKLKDSSGSSDPGASLADAFHEEMLAWYEDQETVKQATLV